MREALIKDSLIKEAEVVSMFCRININKKRNLPIRSSDIALLLLISKCESPITSVMAADFFKVKKPMITTVVTRLQEHGYIERVPSHHDKRSFFLSLTDKARQLINETFTEYFKTIELLRQKLGTEDYQNFITLLEKANQVLLNDKDKG